MPFEVLLKMQFALYVTSVVVIAISYREGGKAKASLDMDSTAELSERV
jgi:hypothetical protein